MVEAATGVTPFARAVLHVGEVRLGGEKMAKSTGNLLLIGEVLQRHAGPAVRLALLDRAWDQPWECAEAEFDRAAERLEQLHAAAGTPGRCRHGAGRGAPPAGHRARTSPSALELALAEGGGAARFLVDVLKLRDAPLP